MSFMSDAYYCLAITTFTDRGTCTEHYTRSRVDIRTMIARYIADNGLRRNAYSDCEQLFSGDTHVGHYTITPR